MLDYRSAKMIRELKKNQAEKHPRIQDTNWYKVQKTNWHLAPPSSHNLNKYYSHST